MTPQPDEIVKAFHADGYVIFRNFMPEVELQQAELEIDKALSREREGCQQGDIFLEDDRTTIRQFEHLQNYAEFFASISHQRRYVDLFERIFEEEAVCKNVSYMAKAARIGSVVPAHQDNAYFNLVPNHALTFWIALDECTEHNGCLRVIPGSHLGGILPHKASGRAGNSYCLVEEPDPGEAGELPVLLKRGDCSIHHADMIHRSLANTSANPRRGLLLAYESVRCEVDEEGVARYQAAVKQMYDRIASQ